MYSLQANLGFRNIDFLQQLGSLQHCQGLQLYAMLYEFASPFVSPSATQPWVIFLLLNFTADCNSSHILTSIRFII